MTIQTIELDLPKILYQRIAHIAQSSQREVKDILIETIDREFSESLSPQSRRNVSQTQSLIKNATNYSSKDDLSLLIAQAQALFDTTLEERYSTEEPNISLFLAKFEQLMYEIWQTTEGRSDPHASISCELLNIAQIYQSGGYRLQLEQLQPLEEVLMLLNRKQLTMEDAAKANQQLLEEGFQTMFQVQGNLDDTPNFFGEILYSGPSCSRLR